MSTTSLVPALLLTIAAVAAVLAWVVRPIRLVALVVAAGAVAAAGAVTAGEADQGTEAMVWAAGLAAAVLGGSPLTQLVFGWVDTGRDVSDRVETAGTVLRGGIWIGVLERAAVYGAVTTGAVEALAVVVAVKTLARYPELAARREGDDVHAQHGVAERFIIGTFTSVLWAAGCAAVPAIG